MANLTPQQRRFVDEYLVDLNATRAAIRAGYSEKTAVQQASRLLTNVNVQAAVAEAQAARAARVGITADNVLRELARLGLSDVRRMFRDDRLLNPGEWTDDAAAAVAGIEVDKRKDPGEDGEYYTVTKIKLWDKNSALEKLCKHLGLFDKDNSQKPAMVVNIVSDDAAL